MATAPANVVKDPSISPTPSGTTAITDSVCDVEKGYSREHQSPKKESLWHSLKRIALKREQSHECITRTLDEIPKGYPLVANFQSSDRNFLQYRGFLYLHSRLLSSLQYDVERLEKELNKLDQWDIDCEVEERERCLGCRQRDDKQTKLDRLPDQYKNRFRNRIRPQVMAELNEKLIRYDEVLLKAKEIHAMQRPAAQDYRSVRNWFESVKPLDNDEAKYIRRKEDIITLRTGRESAVFESLVERLLSGADKLVEHCFGYRPIQKLFLTPELREKAGSQEVDYFAPRRVNKLVNFIITIIIFILLVIPVGVLYKMSNLGLKQTPIEAIGILIIFTLLFGGAMSSLTTATRQELFAASAAYCAVLVVFITNFTTQTVALVK